MMGIISDFWFWFRSSSNIGIVSKGLNLQIQLLIRSRICICDKFDYLALSAVEFDSLNLGVKVP